MSKSRYAIWLYHNVTRAFFTSAPLSEAEAAAVRQAGEDKAAALDPSWECHFKGLDEAIADFAADSDAALYENGVGEQDLIDFFGALGPNGQNVGAAELIATLSSLQLGANGKDLVARVPGAMSVRVGNGVAVLATAVLQHLDHCERQVRAGRDDTDPDQLARLRRAAEDLREAAGGLDPDGPLTLEELPHALKGTVINWLTVLSAAGESRRVSQWPT